MNRVKLNNVPFADYENCKNHHEVVYHYGVAYTHIFKDAEKGGLYKRDRYYKGDTMRAYNNADGKSIFEEYHNLHK